MSSGIWNEIVVAIEVAAATVVLGPEGGFLVFAKAFAVSDVLGSRSDLLTEEAPRDSA